MPISAVIVPLVGRPDKQKHSKSKKLRVKFSSTPAPSTTVWKDLVNLKFSNGFSVAKFLRNGPAVKATPTSNRSAAVGNAATAFANGSIRFIRFDHSWTALVPPICSRTPPARPKSDVWTKSPSGNFSPNVSYEMHSTGSPTIFNFLFKFGLYICKISKQV